MEPVTDEFLKAVRTSHKMHIRSEAWVDGAWTPIEMASGQVSSDYYSMILRDLKGTLSPAYSSILDRDRLDSVSPTIYGTYVRIFRGVSYPNGTKEEVPLGVFVLDNYSRILSGGYTLEFAASDLYSQILRARFEQPRQLKGASRIDVCKALVQEALEPNLPWGPVVFRELPGITDDNLRSTLAERERGEAIRDILEGIGVRGYFAADGAFEFAPMADENDPPVWSLTSGERGTLVSYKESLSREKTYNIAVANGAPTDPDILPVHSVARDTNPASPTYWLGPFGKVPYFYSSQFLYSQAQADAISAALLIKIRGKASAYNVSTIPNPALVAGDVLSITDISTGTDTHLITNLTTPLTADTAMTMTTSLLSPDEGAP